MPRTNTNTEEKPLVQTERDLLIRLDEKFAQLLGSVNDIRTSFTAEMIDMKSTVTSQNAKIDARIAALEVFREKNQIDRKISHWDEAYDNYVFQKKIRVLTWSVVTGTAGLLGFAIQQTLYYLVNVKK